MQLFQSWADVVIMFVLAVAYIITFIVQRNTIISLKDRLSGLSQTNSASAELTSSLAENIKVYKEMFKLEDINEHINIQVSLRTQEKMDDIIRDVTKSVRSDANFWAQAIEWISDDLKSFNTSNFIFLMYVIKKNKMSEKKIMDLVETFFPNHLWVYKEIIDRLPDFLPNSNDTYEPDKQIDPKKD